jgi:hydrogenase maturation protein HypF
MPALHIQVTGKVQGVGFRPFLLRLAQQVNLAGFAINTPQGVSIRISGAQNRLDHFLHTLNTTPPKHARISTLQIHVEDSPDALSTPFEIRTATENIHPQYKQQTTVIPADRALCRACLSELFDPENRRFLHPIISCIECGPRASCIRQLPFERQLTSFDQFEMCSICTEETFTPDNDFRRFHAQGNACRACGPRLSLYRMQPHKEATPCTTPDDPLLLFRQLAKAIQAGEIIAIKGMSGFHLLADARQPEVVARLRRIKQRPDKPFAIMALNSESLTPFVALNPPTRALLEEEAAPIVLVPKRNNNDPISESLAPRVTDLGCMLPNTALHYLLFYALLNAPDNPEWLTQAQAPLLIVTSANPAGEPLISNNEQALKALPAMTDWLVTHDRDILFASDDSVIQSEQVTCPALMIRRARGFAPEPLTLHSVLAEHPSKSVLACGAYLKNTFCFVQNQQVFSSTHLGEQNSRRSCAHFQEQLDYFLRQFALKPEVVACDLHPDFFSSRFAQDYAELHQLPLVQVAHHEAHIASVLNDCHLPANTPFLALALDGLGLGQAASTNSLDAPEHLLWGGELYWGKLAVEGFSHPDLQLKRLAHLSTLALPGGDKASREIGRIGYALQQRTSTRPANPFEDYSSMPDLLKDFIDSNLAVFEQSSSLGRWFDGVASLLGLRQHVSFEGQAAMELEAQARLYGKLPKPRQLLPIEDNGCLNLYPILETLLATHNPPEAAAIFHSELIDGLLRWLEWASTRYPAKDLLCSGGCFQNRIIRQHLSLAAKKSGWRVHFPRHIPVNDAGISIGQALIASLKIKTV